MLMGHAEGVSKLGSSTKLLLSDPESESDGDEEADTILYMASFDELGEKSVQYDTIIWLSISVLLVLAWGIGILMLLYLPMRRYVLKKEISSRKLYVTPDEIVYKVSRPSFIPFWKDVKFEKHVPLPLVIDIIIEQGINCNFSYPVSYFLLFFWVQSHFKILH
uniref:Putative ovule protein n=1 Tax=Solanum chacoense TaxID=4108 RepID=A0A0V0H3D5_SOLCH